MPMVIPAIAAAFATIGSAVGSAVIAAGGFIGATLGATDIGLAVATYGAALGGGLGAAVAFSAWSTTLLVGSSLIGLTMGLPKPQSQGQQINLKLDPSAGVPVLFGRTATGGNVVYRRTFGPADGHLGTIAVLSIGPIDAIQGFYASNFLCDWNQDPNSLTGIAQCNNISPLASGSKLFVGQLNTMWRRGLQPDTAFKLPTTGGWAPLSLPNWDENSKLSGLAAAYLDCYYNTAAFPAGFPNCLWVASGVSCYDPRQDSTYPGGSGSQRSGDQTTWAYSENPAIQALSWCLGFYQNGIRVAGIGAQITQIDVAAFVNAANVCDANSWKGGGVVTTADDKFAALTTILQAGGAVPTQKGGVISCIVNQPLTSLYAITAADVVGQVQIQNTTALRERFNRIVPTYREESNFWQMTAGVAVTAEEYQTEDGGVRNQSSTYNMVQEATQAGQIAAYDLVNAREFLTITVACGPRLLNARIGDALTVDLPLVGLDKQKCVVIGRSFDPVGFQVTLNLRSETDAKHAFALGQSATAPPVPELGNDGSIVDAPGSEAWSVTGTTLTANGNSVPALVINGATDNPNAQTVIVEYRPFGSTVWNTASEVPFSATQVEITTVTALTEYEVAVSYRSVRGIVSDRTILTPDPVTAGQSVASYVSTLPIVYGGANTVTYTANTANGVTGPGGILTLPTGLTTGPGGLLYANGITSPFGGTVDATLNALATGLLANAEAFAASTIGEAQANAVQAQSDAANASALALSASANAAAAASNAATALAEIFGANSTITTIITSLANTSVIANDAYSGLTIETAQRIANVNVLSGLITSLNSNINGVNAIVTALSLTQANDNTALASEITTLNANVAGANTAISNLSTVQATANSAISTALSNLSAGLGAANSNISGVSTALTTANSALSSQLVTVQSNLNAANGVITAVSTALANANSVTASDVATLTAGLNSANTAISTVSTALATANSALSDRLTTISSQLVSNPNLLENPSGSQGLTGWTEDGTTSQWFTNDNPIWGWWFTRVLTGAATLTAYNDFESATIPVFQGEAYTLSGWVYAAGITPGVSGDNRGYQLRAVFCNSSGTELSEFGTTIDQNGGQQFVQATAVAPAGTAYALVTALLTPGTTFSNTYAQVGFWQAKLESGTVATVFNDAGTAAEINAAITSEATTRATADYSLATQVSTVAASSTSSINKAPNFVGYTGGIPAGWVDWESGASGVSAAGTGGGNAYKVTISSGVQQGIAQTIYLTAGWYVVEASYWVETGTASGAGVYLDGWSTPLNFVTDPDTAGNIGVGGTGIRSFSKLVNWPTSESLNIYLMSGWGGFGETIDAKTIDFFKCSIRAASAAEISVGKVLSDTGQPSLTAVVNQINTAITTNATAQASATSTVQAGLNSTNAVVTALSSALATANSVAASATSTVATNLGSTNAMVASLESALSTANAVAASATSTVAANLGSTNATVATQATAITTLQGQTAYYIDLVSTSGGTASVALTSTSGGITDVQLLAGNVSFGPNGTFNETYNVLIFNNGSNQSVYGCDFGASSNLMEWFGPSSVGVSSMSTANCYFAKVNSGDVYYGANPFAPAATDGTIQTGATQNAISLGSASISSSSSFSVTSTSWTDYLTVNLPNALLSGGAWLISLLIPPYSWGPSGGSSGGIDFQIVVRTTDGSSPEVIASTSLNLTGSLSQPTSAQLYSATVFANPSGAPTGMCTVAVQVRMDPAGSYTHATLNYATSVAATLSAFYFK